MPKLPGLKMAAGIYWKKYRLRMRMEDEDGGWGMGGGCKNTVYFTCLLYL